MNSIRPLATITVLTFVGAYLYMKITETEAVLPEGVDTWAIEQDIQIGDGFGGMDDIEVPSFAPSATPPADTAPAFQAGNSAPAFGAAADNATPAWSSQPTTKPNANAPESTPPSAADPVATAPSEEGLPPLPAIPVLNDRGTSSGEGNLANANPPSMTATNNPPPAASGTQYPITPTSSPEEPTRRRSLFATSRLAVQAALDRGELSQALLLLSDWYGDPSLTPQETQEVQTLLSQLAGSVIYSTEPRLEAPYLVQAGETLTDIAQKYDVPWQLLAKINGIAQPDQLAAGQQIKVLRGPFSAVLDLNKRRLTLMLDRRYAGQFDIEFDPSLSVEAGQWVVNQKLVSPTSAGLQGGYADTPTEERSLTLTSAAGETSQLAILCSAAPSSPMPEPVNRMIRLQPTDVADIFDILSLGSKVVIRR